MVFCIALWPVLIKVFQNEMDSPAWKNLSDFRSTEGITGDRVEHRKSFRETWSKPSLQSMEILLWGRKTLKVVLYYNDLKGLSNAQFNWMTDCFLKWLYHVLSWHVSIQRSYFMSSTWWHIGMYLAPIESATVLSTSETAIRDHKSVPIPNHRKLIGSDSDNRVPDRNLDAFPK